MPLPPSRVIMNGSSFCTRSANASGTSARNLQSKAEQRLGTLQT